MSRLFVTGATGFVGRRLLTALPTDAFDEIACLTRDAARLRTVRTDVVPVVGDLLDPAGWRDSVAGAAAVVHLAARTGSAPAAEHWRVNARGTELLVHACESAGVRRFVHVSTVATRYSGAGDQPYAASKRRAEEVVRAAGFAWTIVRPSLIAGREGGAWGSILDLARLPVIPLPCPGDALVRPVWVDDVARVVVEAVIDDRWRGEILDLAGPEGVSVEALLRRVRRRRGRGDPTVVHVPVAPLLPVLGWLDRRGVPLPVTAGQLRSLREDDPGPAARGAPEALATTPLDAMIDRTADVR